MRKIGIIDADLLDNGTRHPNLALMKIAGFYRDNGDEVELVLSYDELDIYDDLYMSKVFNFTYVPKKVLEMKNLHIGGTGFFEDGGKNLPDEIEHHMPYYDLYKGYVERQIELGKSRNNYADYLDYSIGFTTRGCFRKCEFCVNKKYDHVFKHSPVSEFYDEKRPYIYLWDDNILGFPQWREVIEELEATGKPFQFRQGIDIRLMTDEKARVFNNVHYHGDFIFAFDHIEDKERIVEKIQLWKRYSSRVCKLYVISGFVSQDENDIADVFERIATLMKYGCIPYIMRYEDYKKSEYKSMYVELARWCNQPQFFKKKSFREFCVANQEYKKDKNSNCAAYQTMLDFEARFPEIADAYFDLKFEDENIYAKQYGYGRKYANKPECAYCQKKNMCWEKLIETKNDRKILELYFTKEIDLLCLEYGNSDCKIDKEKVGQYLLNLIMKTDISDIIEVLKCSSELEMVTKDNIPQFSDAKDAYLRVPQILSMYKNKEMTFELMGYQLHNEDDPDSKSDLALNKYGENHTKLACLVDLVRISKKGVKSNLELSILGNRFIKLSDEEKEDVFPKLCLRIPIIQHYFVTGKRMELLEKDFEVLSKETIKRRKSNVKMLIELIDGKM